MTNKRDSEKDDTVTAPSHSGSLGSQVVVGGSSDVDVTVVVVSGSAVVVVVGIVPSDGVVVG